MSQSAADALQRRRASFAEKTIDLAGHLPKTSAERHVSGRILRSGTSPAFASAGKPVLKLRLAGQSFGEGRHLAAHPFGGSDGPDRVG